MAYVNDWRSAPGFSRYVVSENGFVRRVNGDFIESQLNQSGYEAVRLVNDDGKKAWVFVHRLILMAHDRMPEPGEEVRHLNGDKLDNRLLNLKWGTNAENTADKIAHGTHQQGEKHYKAVLKDEDVRAIRVRLSTGEKIAAIAKAYGVDGWTIRAIRDRKSWKHLV